MNWFWFLVLFCFIFFGLFFFMFLGFIGLYGIMFVDKIVGELDICVFNYLGFGKILILE